MVQRSFRRLSTAHLRQAAMAAASVLIAQTAGYSAITSDYFDGNGTAAGYNTASTTYSWEGSFWTLTTGGTTATTAYAPGSLAVFQGTATPYTLTVGATESIAGISQTATGVTLNINQTGSGALSLISNGSGYAAGGSTAGAGDYYQFTITSSTGLLNINAPITGGGGIQQKGSGQLSLYGNNTFTGGVNTTGGQIINYNQNSSFGTGAITLSGTSGEGLVGTVSGLTIANTLNFGLGSSTNFASAAATGSTPGTTFTSNAALGATAGSVTINFGGATSNTALTGNITGTPGLYLGGVSSSAGTMTLSGTNTYTGGSTFTYGNLVLGNDSALGASTGGLTFAGGTISANATRSIANPVSLTGTGTVGGANNLTFTGNVTNNNAINGALNVVNSGVTTLAGNVALSSSSAGSASTLTIGGSGPVNISGVISNGGTGANVLSYTGTNVLNLSKANTYTGGTAISGIGSLIASNSSALGTGVATLSSGNLRATAGTTIGNSIVVAAPLNLISGYDFQTTTTGGTAAVAAASGVTVPTAYTANFGNGSLALNGNNTSSTFIGANTGNEVSAFSGSAVNATNGLSTVTASPAALAILGGTSNSANGKSAVFQVSAGTSNSLSVTYATQGTATGFKTQTWSYSLNNGTTFTPLTTVGDTTNGLPAAFSLITLPTITNASGLGNVLYKVTFAGATSASGNNRFDNVQFLVNATAATTAGSAISTVGSDDTSGVITYSGPVTLNDNVNLTAGTGSRVNFSGNISGPTAGYNVAVNKIGGGLVALSGANTYAGTTTVSAGELKVSNTSGSATGTSNVTVAAGATLSGNGRAGGIVNGNPVGIVALATKSGTTAGGNISPDSIDAATPSPIGTLNTNGEVWNPGAVYTLDVSATGPTNDAVTAGGVDSDYIAMTGTLDLSNLSATSKFTINLLYSGSDSAITSPFAIAQATGITLPAGVSISDLFAITVNGAANTDFVVTETDAGGVAYLDTAPTPEISSIGLFGAAAGGLLLLRRRRIDAGDRSINRWNLAGLALA